MSVKIELLDSVIEAFRNSDRELFEEISDEEIRYGITAALEAMVEYGMAMYDSDRAKRNTLIDTARIAGLREAAEIAEAFPARTHGALATAPYAAAEQAAEEIADAILARIAELEKP